MDCRLTSNICYAEQPDSTGLDDSTLVRQQGDSAGCGLERVSTGSTIGHVALVAVRLTRLLEVRISHGRSHHVKSSVGVHPMPVSRRLGRVRLLGVRMRVHHVTMRRHWLDEHGTLVKTRLRVQRQVVLCRHLGGWVRLGRVSVEVVWEQRGGIGLSEWFLLGGTGERNKREMYRRAVDERSHAGAGQCR